MPETVLHIFKNTWIRRLVTLYAPAVPLADHKKQKCLFDFQINKTTNNSKGTGMDFFLPMLGKYAYAFLDLFFDCPNVEVEVKNEECTQW